MDDTDMEIIGSLFDGPTTYLGGQGSSSARPNDTEYRARMPRTSIPEPPPPRQASGFVGLENQGATCYLNSLIQALYMTPEFRNALFELTPDMLGLDDEAVAELQKELESAIVAQAPPETASTDEEEGEEKPKVVTADDERVKSLAMMGFNVAQCIEAVKRYESDMDRGVEWILNGCAGWNPEAEGASEQGPGWDFSEQGTGGEGSEAEGGGGAEEGGEGGSSAPDNGESAGPKRRLVRRILLELQRLFAEMAVSDVRHTNTKRLTDSFGWNEGQAGQQHDVHELNRVLFDAIERSLHRTMHASLLQRLYGGVRVFKTKCLNCNNITEREDTFQDLTVSVAHRSSITESLFRFSEAETMSGDNKYHCEKCGSLQDARRWESLRKLPPILIFSLARFEYDSSFVRRIKVNDRFHFPLSLDVSSYVESAVPDGGRDPPPETPESPQDGDAAEVTAPPGESGDSGDQEAPQKTAAELRMEREGEWMRGRSIHEPAVADDAPPEHVYELFGVIIHVGQTGDHGHYHAYLRDVNDSEELSADDLARHCVPTNLDRELEEQLDAILEARGAGPARYRWFDFDDSFVRPIPEKQLMTQFGLRHECAYMLVYRSRALPLPSNDPAPDLFREKLLAQRSVLEEARARYDEESNHIELTLYHPNHFEMLDGGMVFAPKLPRKPGESQTKDDEADSLPTKVTVQVDWRTSFRELKERASSIFSGLGVPTVDRMLMDRIIITRTGRLERAEERFEEFPPQEEEEGGSSTADASTPAAESDVSTPAPDGGGGEAGAQTSGEEDQAEPSKESTATSTTEDGRGGAAGGAVRKYSKEDEPVSVCNIGVGHKMDLLVWDGSLFQGQQWRHQRRFLTFNVKHVCIASAAPHMRFDRFGELAVNDFYLEMPFNVTPTLLKRMLTNSTTLSEEDMQLFVGGGGGAEDILLPFEDDEVDLSAYSAEPHSCYIVVERKGELAECKEAVGKASLAHHFLELQASLVCVRIFEEVSGSGCSDSIRITVEKAAPVAVIKEKALEAVSASHIGLNECRLRVMFMSGNRGPLVDESRTVEMAEIRSGDRLLLEEGVPECEARVTLKVSLMHDKERDASLEVRRACTINELIDRVCEAMNEERPLRLWRTDFQGKPLFLFEHVKNTVSDERIAHGDLVIAERGELPTVGEIMVTPVLWRTGNDADPPAPGTAEEEKESAAEQNGSAVEAERAAASEGGEADELPAPAGPGDEPLAFPVPVQVERERFKSRAEVLAGRSPSGVSWPPFSVGYILSQVIVPTAYRGFSLKPITLSRERHLLDLKVAIWKENPWLKDLGAVTPYHLRMWAKTRVLKRDHWSLKKQFIQHNMALTVEILERGEVFLDSRVPSHHEENAVNLDLCPNGYDDLDLRSVDEHVLVVFRRDVENGCLVPAGNAFFNNRTRKTLSVSDVISTAFDVPVPSLVLYKYQVLTQSYKLFCDADAYYYDDSAELGDAEGDGSAAASRDARIEPGDNSNVEPEQQEDAQVPEHSSCTGGLREAKPACASEAEESAAVSATESEESASKGPSGKEVETMKIGGESWTCPQSRVQQTDGKRGASMREDLVCSVQYVKDGDVLIFKDARDDPDNIDQFVDEIERGSGAMMQLRRNASPSTGNVVYAGYHSTAPEPVLKIHVDDFAGEESGE